MSMDVSQKVETCVQQFLGEKPNYQKYNDMTGALVRCGKELNRRIGTAFAHYMQQFLLELMESYDDQIDIYEDLKIKENGDVE